MDTHTLVVTNVVLFGLYAGVMLVNARISGGSQGAYWFVGSNLCRGASYLILALYGPPDSPLRAAQATGGVLAAVGTMMLYRSFVELLERGPLLRRVQYSLVAIVLVVTVYLMAVPHRMPVGPMLLSLLLGVQLAVTAAVVFRFSGEDVGVAGWLTGAALSAYALVMLMRALVMMQFGSPEYEELTYHMDRIWLEASMVTNSAIAFGFMFLSAAKVRVELLWRAQVDELTGLLNRWALKRVAMREIQRCRRMKGTLAVVMMLGVLLGAYHAGVEWKLWEGPTDCTGPISDFGSTGNLLRQMEMTSIVRCDEAAWRFLGLSLAGYNVLISAVLAGLAIGAVALNQRHEKI